GQHLDGLLVLLQPHVVLAQVDAVRHGQVELAAPRFQLGHLVEVVLPPGAFRAARTLLPGDRDAAQVVELVAEFAVIGARLRRPPSAGGVPWAAARSQRATRYSTRRRRVGRPPPAPGPGPPASTVPGRGGAWRLPLALGPGFASFSRRYSPAVILEDFTQKACT